jgi:hypothetical protein
MKHRWSGWPGAWCLDCGCNDPMEQMLADGRIDDDGLLLPDALKELEAMPACPEAGSNRHNPYTKA